MVTILDCIKRTPEKLEAIIGQRDETFLPLEKYLDGKLAQLDEVIFIGSGTSSTSAMTSRSFVEKVSGLRTRVCVPNDVAGEGRVYNPNGLYVFTSQTGTSIVTRQVQKQLLDAGLLCVSMTEGEYTPLAKDAAVHVDLGCGKEEYGMRTLGYSCTVLTHMLMGLKLGLGRGKISAEEYGAYLELAAKLPESHRKITADAGEWFEKNKRQIMRSQCVLFTGSDTVYGVALEAALKFWEMPQVISIGFELEESLHGPNYGYNSNHCVVALDDGGRDSKKSQALARYVKDVYRNGFIIGPNPVEEKDLKLDLKSGAFSCIEIAAAVQVMAYLLAEDGGRDTTIPNDHAVMNRYFRTHQ